MNQTPVGEKESTRVTVVLRGASALIFPEGRGYAIDDAGTNFGPTRISYTSRWLTPAKDVKMPGQLWVEVTGYGPDFESTVPRLANAALRGLPIMSVAGNAAIQDPQLEIAFEATEGIEKREFLQAYVRPESQHVSNARFAQPDAIARLTEAIVASPYRDELLRASDQYRMALDSWAIGGESLTLSHLWMAVEALTLPQRNELMKTQQVTTNAALASKLGLKNIKELDGHIRKQYLLAGDAECYTKAKSASDGFEHGYMPFSEVRSHAMEVRERLAHHARAAIFHLAHVSGDLVAALTRAPYEKPLGTWPLVKFITGTLEGKSSELAKPGNAYPVIIWQHEIKSVAFDPEGKMQVQFRDRMRAELGSGITLRPRNLQLWQGGSGIPLGGKSDARKGSSPIEVEISSTASDGNKAGLAIDDPAMLMWVQPLGSFIVNCNAIRHLSWFWLRALSGRQEFRHRPVPLIKTVSRLTRILARRGVSEALRQRCHSAWNEAIELNEARVVLAGAAPAPEGLVILDRRNGGLPPLVTDVGKILELNDKAVATGKELYNLLQELQALPAFRSNPTTKRLFRWLSLLRELAPFKERRQ